MSDSFAFDTTKIKESFFSECEDYISSMESYILELEETPDDKELLNALFRAVHSIKGNSGCLGFNDIYSFTHRMETVLDRLRNGEMSFTGELSTILLESVDCIKLLVESAKKNQPPPDGVDGVLQKVNSLLGDTSKDEPTSEDTGTQKKSQPAQHTDTRLFKIVFEPDSDILKWGMDPVRLLKKLGELGDIINIKASFEKLPELNEMDPELCYLSWEIYLVTKERREAIESVFEFVKDRGRADVLQLIPCESTEDCVSKSKPKVLQKVQAPTQQGSTGGASPTGSTKRSESSTIRVDIEKIEQLVNLVGELLITQTIINQLSTDTNHDRAGLMERAVSQLKRNTMAIQERVMSIRMLPIGNIFTRFKRLVRDLATQKQKKIKLVITGEDTELDKTVIERLVDPLTHLLRNAVDHGIESPEERIEKGKPEEGVVCINAFHEGGKVVITVEDDGRGINKEKIFRKAVERGLVEEQKSLSDEELYNLIFTPGFSTADKVTDISGRGVGMDVVKKNIEAMGGTVAIESEEGCFTRFTIRLPLTLAIIDGLIVKVGDEKFIIPITTVLESKRPLPEEVKTVEKKGEVINFRGRFVPLIRLHRVFGIRPLEEKPWCALVVVVSIDGKQYGLLVDELVGEQQVVIKSMGCLQGITGIAGGTILGDGKVALIVDGPGIIKRSICC